MLVVLLVAAGPAAAAIPSTEGPGGVPGGHRAQPGAVTDRDWAEEPEVLSSLWERLRLPVPGGLDDLPRAARETHAAVRIAFGALGLDHGTRLDDADLLAAKERLRVPVGRRLDADDVADIIARAHAQVEASLLLLDVPYGTRIDDGDVRRAAARLGLDVGSQVDPADVRRIVVAGQRRLHRQTEGRVIDGLGYSRWVIDLAGGRAVVHRLEWNLRDPRVEIRTVPSGRFGQRASVLEAVRARAGTGAVAAVNGGFWHGGGDPDGLLVTGGRLVSEPGDGPSWLRGSRAAFGIGEGGYVVGQASGGAQFSAPGSGEMRVQGIDRPLRRDDVVVYTSSYGDSTHAPPGTVEVPVIGVPVTTEGKWQGRKAPGSLRGNSGIPRDGIVIAATGNRADQLRRMVDGATVTFNVAVSGFTGVREAIAGGPLLLEHRRATTRAQWHSEGFGAGHNDRRHPRTAVGFTDDGRAMAVVVDGRRSGHSVGTTTAETAALMRAFGAVDALMLDGGGSSQMAIGSRIANRPCCDDGLRPVATSIVFHRAE